MKHHVTWLSVLPLALAMANLAEAGFRCGGCSDPCRPSRVAHGFASARSCGSGYSGYSVVEASPASCGEVSADGSYGMYYGAATSNAPMAGCANLQATVVVQSAPQSSSQTATMIAPQIVCEPITGYRTVMESTFVTETQYVNAMETKQETRTRVKKVSKSAPVTVDDFRTKTVMVPTTETKTIEYTVLVPEQSTKTVDVTVTVPVWNEVSENYTVKVPTISDVIETYNVSVPRLKDESFTYTVYVPQTETVTKVQTVTNAVPVVKTRTVQRTIPIYTTQSVSKDYGHWETVVEEVAGSSYGAAPAMSYAAPAMSNNYGCGNAAMSTTVVSGGCGNGLFAGRSRVCGCASKSGRCVSTPVNSACGAANGCGSTVNSGCRSNAIINGSVMNNGTMVGGCSTGMIAASAPSIATTTRRVWVPSVVTEEVSVVTNSVQNEEVAYTVYEQQSTQVPYECAYVVYRPDQRTGTKKVVEYVSEPRTRTRKVVSYTDEQRTRTRRVLSYTTQSKQESYPVVTYKTEKKSKEISFVVNVPTQSVESFQTTRYETVSEDVLEDYVVSVQVPTTKEVQVQVCKMVPKLVAYTFNPCAASTSGYSTGGVSGCGCGVPAPAPFAASSASPSCDCGAFGASPATCRCAK